jgi:succinoglycan biosynthesis protein ExoV
MKLFYYQGNNFGDKLNPLIWNALIPDVLDDDDDTVLVGIGTLINSNAPKLQRKIVMGAGAGYMSPAQIDDTWVFYCVRGPLTAQTLGLDQRLAITDPALLLTQVVTGPVTPAGDVCFMPHHTSTNYADWGALCAKAGITYLDPAADMHEVLTKIRGARLVIAEAMHGAIVADAFRVPWVPVQCYDHILDFKWQDWCKSMELEYQPQPIASVWDVDRTLSPRDRLAANVKRGLRSAGIWTDRWTAPFPATNINRVEETVIAALTKLAGGEHACLSKENVQQTALERLLEQVERVNKNHTKVNY